MKQKIIIIVLVFLLLMALGILAVVLIFKNIDFEKESIKAREFASLMEDENYEIVDITSQYETYGIDEAYIAIESDQDYQIEFY